jgi:hypothetical protein
MEASDRELIRAAYLALRSGQEVIRAVAVRTLGSVSNHAFTIDGKLLGDLGELVACLEFGLTPAPTGTKGIDAHTINRESVEVKSTAGSREVYIPGNSAVPDYLVVVSFNPLSGDWSFIYYGTAVPIWPLAKHPVDSGRAVTLRTLAEVQATLRHDDVLQRVPSAESS